MASPIGKTVLTHNQRACRLYKKYIRHLRDFVGGYRTNWRYEVVLLRAQFDEFSAKEKDLRKLAALIDETEAKIKDEQVPTPSIFKNDPGGITYNRAGYVPDYILDYWHPWEKANYLDYFDKRDAMKKDYAKYWEQSFEPKLERENVPYPQMGKAVNDLPK